MCSRQNFLKLASVNELIHHRRELDVPIITSNKWQKKKYREHFFVLVCPLVLLLFRKRLYSQTSDTSFSGPVFSYLRGKIQILR